MTRQDKMKINYLLVKMKQMEDEFERYKLFDNQIEAYYNRVFDWCVTNRTMLDEQCRKIGELKAEIKHLNTIVENLDELLGKGINDYIKGIDGVEGIKDMWARSAVMEFAKKIKEKYSLYDDRHILYRIIDELLKEYE